MERAEWLADILAGAYMLPSWQRCHDCPCMSRECCRECWLELAEDAAAEREEDAAAEGNGEA